MVASADTGDSALNGFDSRLRFPAGELPVGDALSVVS